MLTCHKLYRDIPFAHRQPKHDGHCAFIHGHNWDVRLTFACTQTDENGFVVDFGKLRYIKEWLDTHLDHACVLREDDTEGRALMESTPGLFKPYFVEDCSCEGIAVHLFKKLDPLVRIDTDGRAWISEISVYEDSKNSVTYAP